MRGRNHEASSVEEGWCRMALRHASKPQTRATGQPDMNKTDIRNVMLDLEARHFNCTRQSYLDYLAASRQEEGEVVVIDERAQAELAADLSEAFDQPLHDHERKIAKLRTVDFTPKVAVSEGALVKLLGRFFVVAVATDRFRCGTQEVMGISTDAPIYQAMEGRTAGEAFEYNGRSMMIEEVL